jgi:F-type H+-transporting ATPase subunit b
MNELFTAFGVDWRLLLIQAVNFGLLLFVLSYFLYKPVLRIIDERQKKIAESVKTAQEAAKRLEDAKRESEGIVGGAAREAESLVAQARNRAQERENEIVRAAEVRADALMKEAQQRAEEEKRQVLLESQREIARAAMLAAEKVLREKSA